MANQQKVLVTGANGHLGLALTRLLVERGYQVRVGVRQAADPLKTRHLRELNVELREIDLLDPASLSAAAEGMEGVFQVAAVFRMWAPDPQREIIEPTVQGGVNVLRAAQQAGVNKVIFTSSVAAVGLESPGGRPLTEDDWLEHSELPYLEAKRLAERAAWEFAKESGLNLVVINPGTILGPGFYRHTPSTQIIDSILQRRYPGAPPFGTSYVDVRDVAAAHLLAYENANAQGRYLAVNGPFVSMSKLMELVQQVEPAVPLKTRPLSRVTMNAGVLLDWVTHLVTGRPRELTRAMLHELMNHYVCFSHEKATRELGWEPRDFRTCLRDTVIWIRRTFTR